MCKVRVTASVRELLDSPVKARRILPAFSISSGKSPVTGQNLSLPNLIVEGPYQLLFRLLKAQPHLSRIIVHLAANCVRPLPRFFIRYASPSLSLVLHRFLPCFLAYILARDSGRGGRRGFCRRDPVDVTRRRRRGLAHSDVEVWGILLGCCTKSAQDGSANRRNPQRTTSQTSALVRSAVQIP